MTYPFASIHLRSEREEDVGDLVSGLECFHSPPILGWISIFERDSGEGDLAALGSLAALLTEEVDCTGVAILGIDESAFFYLVFKSGELIDEYGSDPSYFGEVSDEEARALAGNPDVLNPLLIPGATTGAIKAVLTDVGLSTEDRCGGLCRLLGIQNGTITYADFLDDEEGNSVNVIGREYFERSGGEPVELNS